MTKEILVSIKGLQFEIDEDETVEVISVGDYYFRNGKHYIIYDDMIVDGKDGNHLTKNTIKISNDQVEIMKKGASSVHMLFEKNKKNVTFYNTPFGELLIGLYTTKIDFMESEDKMELELEYALDVNSSHISDCLIQIVVQPRNLEK